MSALVAVPRGRSKASEPNLAPWSEHFRIPPQASTINGFRAWFASSDFPKDIRASLIDGELYIEPSMEDLPTHNGIKTAVSWVMAKHVDDFDLGHFCNDGMLLTHKKAGLSTVPDALFASFASIESRRVRISTIGKGELLVEWRGTPDWVLEIVSNSSETKDYEELLDAYFRAGVPEYWLIDARGENIDFRIYRPGKRGYRQVQAKNGWLSSPLFEHRFRLTRELNRAKMWRYRLHIDGVAE